MASQTDMPTLFTAPLRWAHFLPRAALSLGLLLCSSALITVIAANWSHIDKMWRISGTQALIVVLVLGSLWWGRRRPAAWRHAHSPANALLAAAGVAVGGLFALLGQTYQTGADPWQLFALWALVLVPWLWASRSMLLILLWVVLLNLSLALWAGASVDLFGWASLRSYGYLVGLNAVLLMAAECVGPRVHDTHRLLARLTASLLTAALIMALFEAVGFDNRFPVALLLVIGISVGLWWRYLHLSHHFDLWMGCLSYALAVAASISVLGHLELFYVSGLLLVIVVYAVVAFFVVRDLSRRWNRHQQGLQQVAAVSGEAADQSPTPPISSDREDAQPWFLRLFRSALVVVLGVLLSLFVGAYLWTDAPYYAAVLMGVAFVVAVLMSRLGSQAWHQDMAAAVLVLGLIFGVISHAMQISELGTISLLLYCLIGVVLYVFCTAWPMRFLSSIWTVAHYFFALIHHYSYGFVETALDTWRLPLVLELGFCVFIVLSLGLAAYAHRSRHLYRLLSPAMWVVLVSSLIAAYSLTPLWTVDAELGWQWHWHGVPLLLVALPTLSLYVALRRSQALDRVGITALIALAGASVAWAGFPLLLVAVTWGVQAYFWRHKLMQVVVSLAILGGLGLFYYSLSLSLNHKALMLLIVGLFLLCAGALLWWQSRTPEAAEPTQTMLSTVAYRQSFIALGLMLCLGLANYNVWSKEQLLRTGQPVALELAPVDPRSLMQGDYMTLRYQISNDLFNYLNDATLESLRSRNVLWVWVDVGSNYPSAQLRAIQGLRTNEPVFLIDGSNPVRAGALPTDGQLIKLRLKRIGQGWTPGTNAWFFPEGQAARYEQARYGEFVVGADGTALLRAMLDSNGQVILLAHE